MTLPSVLVQILGKSLEETFEAMGNLFMIISQKDAREELDICFRFQPNCFHLLSLSLSSLSRQWKRKGGIAAVLSLEKKDFLDKNF